MSRGLRSLVLALGLALGGCGVKGMPVAPGADAPPPEFGDAWWTPSAGDRGPALEAAGGAG